VQLPGGKTLEFAIPPGTRSGQTIRLRGQGEAGFGGTPGDALITIELVPHPLFRVEGDNLRVDLPVTLDEAVLGGKVKAPTLEGTVTLTVPPASDAGKSLRLKGKGLPNAAGGRGDLFVTLRIVLPDPMDPELEALVRRWRQEGRADIRGRAYES
jgi:DnaJ-class molecular chaperone